MKLKSVAWGFSILLLLLVGVSAGFGGAALVIDPTGKTLGMSVEGLQTTFFDNYLAPGLILFFAVGIFTLVTAVITMLKYPIYATLIFIQGAILTGWILVQVYLLPQTHVLQLLFFLLGLLLMLLGNFQKSKRAL